MSILKRLNTPVFKAEGLLHIPREKAFVEFLVDQKTIATLSYYDILKLPQTTLNLRLTSVSGWSVRANWQGVLWKDMVDSIGIADDSKFIVFASEREYTTNVYREDVLTDRWLFCIGVDGEPIEDEYGGPVRMIIPNLWGYKSCKWLASVRFTNANESGYWETRGYTDRGLIAAGVTLDVNSGLERKISGGEVMDF